MTFVRLPLAVRFWPKVHKTDGCWFWLGRVRPDGYGTTRGEDLRHVPAHRAAWMLTYGSIPEGLCVCHTCDVRHCVNPKHLFLGTIKDNKLDEMRKGRHGFGVQHPLARITETDVVRIRSAFNAGTPITTLAKQYRFTYQNIRRIVRRETWRHVA